MSENRLITSVASKRTETTRNTDNYSKILDSHGLSFKQIGYYLQVGEIVNVQGWILHISAVKWQITDVLEAILPVLILTQVPFKIVKDKDTAICLLNSSLGPYQSGKIISLYPKNEELALTIVKELIPLTTPFKGPTIFTDILLGGNVYTRYGAFNPILVTNAEGKQEKFIYNHKGELTLDNYEIPFRIPEGTTWPFSEIANPTYPEQPTTFFNKYKIFQLLKEDVKGNVYKAIYLKKLFLPKICIIKQARKHMWSDDSGRDMIDRLVWQKDLHTRLQDSLPIPRIIDFFIENTNAYLAMQYIPGPSLLEKAFQVNKNCNCWDVVPLTKKELILNYLLQVITILAKLHIRGLIHRDLTCVNFLVDKKNKLFIIDNELAYDKINKQPTPAYEAGTKGFMSPQQSEGKVPTEFDDIYSLAVLIITTFIGIAPLQLISSNRQKLIERLLFFIGNCGLPQTLSDCLVNSAEKRPSLFQIQLRLQEYIIEIKKEKKTNRIANNKSQIRNHDLTSIINRAIKGLVNKPTIIDFDLWPSKVPLKNRCSGMEISEFAKSAGLFEGIPGILYLLARARHSGYIIEDCENSFNKGWYYIKNEFLKHPVSLTPGMYGGAAGIALALFWSIKSGLQEENEENISYIRECIKLKTSNLDVATGIAGQGLVAVQCRKLFNDEEFETLLYEYVKGVLKAVDKKGLWVLVSELSGKSKYATSFSYGNTGILFFLLESLSHLRKQETLDVITRSLDSILSIARRVIKKYRNLGCRSLLDEDVRILDGIQGLILTLSKAYGIFKDDKLKKTAENLLFLYPQKVVHANFNQYIGLSSLGELYLTANELLENVEWKNRAELISEVLLHTLLEGSNESLYWLGYDSEHAQADFMTGNSGIIHFLIRVNSNNLGYRLFE